ALLAAAAEVLDRLDVLAGWRLTQTRLARHTEQADELAIWHALVGDQPVPLPVEAVGAHPGCTYLLGPAGEFVPFHPLALFEEPKADFSFYSRRTPELGYEFLNYTTGEVRQKAPRWSFDELLSGAVPAYTRPDRPEHDLGPITAPYE